MIKGSADGRPCDVVPAFDYQSPRAAARMERRSQIPTGGPTPGRRDARILSRHFTSLWPSYRPWTAACGKDGLERRWSRRRPWHSPTLSGVGTSDSRFSNGGERSNSSLSLSATRSDVPQ